MRDVSDDQVDDRLDEALQYFAQYHYDGIEKMYLKTEPSVIPENDKKASLRIVFWLDNLFLPDLSVRHLDFVKFAPSTDFC